MKWITLTLALLAISAIMAAIRVHAMGTGLIFNDVTLDDGATDGDDSYFRIGKDLIIIARPGSYEHELLSPLKGKKVYFELREQ